MMFTCLRCGESYWQSRDYSAVTRMADSLVDRGRSDEALKMVRDVLERDNAR